MRQDHARDTEARRVIRPADFYRYQVYDTIGGGGGAALRAVPPEARHGLD